MQIWHLTPDAGRDPHRVTPGTLVRLRIGTWPVEPEQHIVPHRAFWTFSAPVDAIQAGDELIIRTNCPGSLAWSVDGWATAREAPMGRVGGVMAGAARYAITLGPFSAGPALRFRFRCQHPDCAGDSPCCRGDERVVTVAGGVD